MSTYLYIEYLNKLKIKKVKPYKVVFSYEDKEYLLIDVTEKHETYEGKRVNGIRLLKRKKVRQDRYVVDELKFVETLRNVRSTIKDISKVNTENINYSNVDREYFAKILTELEFNGGRYRAELDNIVEKEVELKEQIMELTQTISKMYCDWRTTPGHGSKQYGMDFKAWLVERVKGAKDGDYCEEYNDYYGNTHPEYGGKLVDLYSLPVGTSFYACNGGYDACIGVNNHGDKTIVTCTAEVTLTKDHHSLYISMSE